MAMKKPSAAKRMTKAAPTKAMGMMGALTSAGAGARKKAPTKKMIDTNKLSGGKKRLVEGVAGSVAKMKKASAMKLKKEKDSAMKMKKAAMKMKTAGMKMVKKSAMMMKKAAMKMKKK